MSVFPSELATPAVALPTSAFTEHLRGSVPQVTCRHHATFVQVTRTSPNSIGTPACPSQFCWSRKRPARCSAPRPERSNSPLELGTEQVLKRAVGAFDPRTEHGLLTHVHRHEQVGIRDRPDDAAGLHDMSAADRPTFATVA